MANPAESQHGYMLTGLVLNVTLLGIMITQLYIYYTTYKRDRPWMKAFVAFLFLADVANSVVIYAYMYRVLILNFGDTEHLFYADWVFAAGPATTAIVGTTVQLFFAWRVRILTQQWKASWVAVAVVAALALTSGVAGIVSCWEVHRHPSLFRFIEFHQIVSTWLAASAACDFAITTFLIAALRKQKTGFKRSDLIIDRIIRLIMQTGMLTMVVAVLDLIFFLSSTSGLHLVFNYALSKLYSNSLISTLNSRKASLYGSAVDTDEDGNATGTASRIPGTGFTSTFRRDNDIVNLSRPPRAEVFIQVEEHELADTKHEESDSLDEKNLGSPRPHPSFAV